MRIIVCAKQVPDTTEVRIDPVSGTLIREGVPSILNPDDANALEEALLMKDENKLKQYFNEQSKALKLYIIFIIVSIVIGIVVYGFMIAALISGVLNSSSYYNSY